MSARKLIEVALPLEAINKESAREKSIRHGHPSTLHLWWSRKPTATARAVLFAQLVDDPSSHPDRFPTEEAVKAERARLHGIIERLVKWENIHDDALYHEARAEIWKSTNGNPPPVLDPFAGGGSIPLEAQRLGLEAHASDLNPVAVLLNKALIEIPPKFRDRPPVAPGLAGSRVGDWRGPAGLAADVLAYGEWMREEAQNRIGHLYPKATLDDGSKATVIAWIWARTVTCPNPVCGIEMPLTSKWWLGKRKGKEAYIIPTVVPDATHPSGQRVDFTIGHDVETGPTEDRDGTVGRAGARCVACAGAVSLPYVRAEGRSGRMGARMMAIVGEGARSRTYLEPTDGHSTAASVPAPLSVPDGDLPSNPRDFKTPNYGMTTWSSLFTNRQLTALTTFSDLVAEARERVLQDAFAAGMQPGERLEAGGTDAEAYADAVATYLALTVSRCADYWSSLCSWNSSRENVRNVFGRQAIPMMWDYAECMPFSNSSGGFSGQLKWVHKVIENCLTTPGFAVPANASEAPVGGLPLSTDPPYYDNIGYSDLSDFFYVWIRRSLGAVHPKLLSTLLVPKAEELVANPYRHGGREGAKKFFEQGFNKVFQVARENTSADIPITIYYAFKQSDTTTDGVSSSGWETLLDGMIRSAWCITATWPMRSERAGRMVSLGTNALASSIVLSLRPRPMDAPSTDRRGLISALQAELPTALKELQHGAISPVDLPQAAIGPGMAVFSRYASVIEADGSSMTVRSALARINEILDQVLNEQEGDFDPTTRFAVAWYRQHGYGTGPFGDADNLAHARNSSVDFMARSGILTSGGGKVTLLKPEAMPSAYDVMTDEHISAWEVLHHLIRIVESNGITAAAEFLKDAESRPAADVDTDLVKELAFLLFSIAEKNRWTKDAVLFNKIATAWPDVATAARSVPAQRSRQSTLQLEEV